MMIVVFFLVLTTVMVASVGEAVTVMDQPLEFSIFDELEGCNGVPISTGTITSLVAIKNESGAFCENTVQTMKDGNQITVFTKIKITSCDAIPMGFVFLDAYTCMDSTCSDCTDVDNTPVQANLMIPEYDPLPAADVCWGVKATTTGITIFNQFNTGANASGIESYWRVYTENSCLSDTFDVSASSPLSMGLKSLSVVSMGCMLLVTFLLN